MNITIGVLAHVDAGKTTFCESLLYHTNIISKLGRVDHKSSFLDSHELEKDRGITIFTDQAVIQDDDNTYYLIDTPGHIDFSSEMERAIKVMDYAIIILSAVEGVEGHTETVWNLLRKHSVPTFFFINKIDRNGADINLVINEIKENLTKECILIEDMQDKVLYEYAAMYNEDLYELYMEENFSDDKWLKNIQNLIKEEQIFICQAGSALKDEGVVEFFCTIKNTIKTNYQRNQALKARVYKISHDKNNTKLTYLKLLSGSLSNRLDISYYKDNLSYSDKITSIREYNGLKYKSKNEAFAGEMIAVTGLSNSYTGMIIGDYNEVDVDNIKPTLKSRVIFDSSINIKEVISVFYILNEEDPTLNVEWNEYLQELHIQVMGPIQLEVLKKVVEKRFNMNVDFEKPKILYKESILGYIYGYGHYEPYRHYSEVHLKIEQLKRDSGVIFESNCHVNDLNVGSQNIIKQHIVEKAHRGLLTGSPLTDVKVTLINGRIHKEHTSGGDLKEATLRALRQGLEKAKNILLEPYYSFKIKVDNNDMGRVLSDIQKRNGEFNAPMVQGNNTIIKGFAPVACFIDYPIELRSFSGGKAMIQLNFGGYRQCHNSDKVISEINYDKDGDREYSSSSVFCGKGKTFSIPWNEVNDYIHLEIPE